MLVDVFYSADCALSNIETNNEPQDVEFDLVMDVFLSLVTCPHRIRNKCEVKINADLIKMLAGYHVSYSQIKGNNQIQPNHL